ncbi:MAG: hypothetical protein HQ567_33440 [Candidatus Nealsonbacteria bacterium]|nr:hypothetical protein [Candidatus Nealsonbacteria bacterium]
MKRQFLKYRRLVLVGVFLAGALAIDQGFGVLLKRVLPQVKKGQNVGLVNVALDHSEADIFIFGSSRAQHHIMPAVLTKELGCSAFNAGCNGQGILYHHILARLMLARDSNTRLFILNVDPGSFYVPQYQRALVLAPYLEEDPVVRELIVCAAEPYGEFKAHSSTWRFNSIALPIVLRALSSNPEPDTDGFVPLFGDFKEIKPREANAKFYDDVVERHRQFIRDARNHGVAVVFVVGPCFDRDHSYPKGMDTIAKLAREEDVSVLYLDEREYPVFCDKAYYRDRGHLNAEGAEKLTQLLAKQLKKQKILLPKSGKPDLPQSAVEDHLP